MNIRIFGHILSKQSSDNREMQVCVCVCKTQNTYAEMFQTFYEPNFRRLCLLIQGSSRPSVIYLVPGGPYLDNQALLERKEDFLIPWGTKPRCFLFDLQSI